MGGITERGWTRRPHGVMLDSLYGVPMLLCVPSCGLVTLLGPGVNIGQFPVQTGGQTTTGKLEDSHPGTGTPWMCHLQVFSVRERERVFSTSQLSSHLNRLENAPFFSVLRKQKWSVHWQCWATSCPSHAELQIVNSKVPLPLIERTEKLACSCVVPNGNLKHCFYIKRQVYCDRIYKTWMDC